MTEPIACTLIIHEALVTSTHAHCIHCRVMLGHVGLEILNLAATSRSSHSSVKSRYSGGTLPSFVLFLFTCGLSVINFAPYTDDFQLSWTVPSHHYETLYRQHTPHSLILLMSFCIYSSGVMMTVRLTCFFVYAHRADLSPVFTDSKYPGCLKNLQRCWRHAVLLKRPHSKTNGIINLAMPWSAIGDYIRKEGIWERNIERINFVRCQNVSRDPVMEYLNLKRLGYRL